MGQFLAYDEIIAGKSRDPYRIVVAVPELPVIEDIAAVRRATQGSEGRPLCGGCGKPFVDDHTCVQGVRT